MATRESSRLSSKKRALEDLRLQGCPTPPRPPKKKKTGAEATRDWLKRMQENSPERYSEYREKNKAMCKAYRKNATEAEKEKQRAQARERMRQMRERRKEQQLEKPPVTRALQEEKRAKWREEKKQQAEKMSAQKRRRINEKRRARYRAKTCASVTASAFIKVATSAASSAPAPLSPLSTPKKRTPAAQRQALARARAAISKSPHKFHQTVTDLIEKASPRKRLLFDNIRKDHQEIGAAVLQNLEETKHKRSKAVLQARKLLKSCCVPKGIEKCQRRKSKPKKEPRKKTDVEQARQFLISVSVPMPEKRLVSKKNGCAASVLPRPLADLRKEFIEESGSSISFSRFARCRPKHVRTMQQARLRQCLCEYCTNVYLKLMSVNGIAARLDNSCRIRHSYHAVDLITCGRTNGEWKKSCANRECGACGDNGLDQHLAPLLRHQGPMTWMKWDHVATDINGKKMLRMKLIRKTGSLADLIGELRQEVSFLAGHLFRANWQQGQFDLMKKQIPCFCGTVGMVLDFAENFTCSYQDEVQSARWHYEQVTVHPIVTYYGCSCCDQTVSESLVFISNDKSHDFDAVFKFMEIAMQHLKITRKLDVQHIIQWTDGCAAQYKSKGPFADISYGHEDFGCSFERHFFGSRHGKGPSDGESAVVKHHASSAIKAGTAIITTARELFEYCQASKLNKQPEEGCHHFLRTFFYVPTEDIMRQRGRAVKTVKGTRSLHAVRCVEPNKLLTRELSCLCHHCWSNTGQCSTAAVTEEWKSQKLDPCNISLPDTPLHACSPLPPDSPVPAAVDPVPEGYAPEFQVDTFITAMVPGRKRTVPFYAKILEADIETEDLKIQFLERKCHDSDSYVLTKVAWITFRDVLSRVKHPRFAPGRGLAFIFEN